MVSGLSMYKAFGFRVYQVLPHYGYIGVAMSRAFRDRGLNWVTRYGHTAVAVLTALGLYVLGWQWGSGDALFTVYG